MDRRERERERMSGKLRYSITEENPDLQKQIGCMNGIFQLFDRHQFLGGRRITGHHHKRLPPGIVFTMASLHFEGHVFLQ
ncbi:unnamed protein product [Ilex paraguariensis]|uniref:Uncharacterized protein n=1 Tax=Ilex paraguariensis TaxID=185542 RepID=A0ABC8UYH5_9AQUA